jgi:hypothetical protein
LDDPVSPSNLAFAIVGINVNLWLFSQGRFYEEASTRRAQ